MAVVSTLLGGVCGFLTFIIALTVFDMTWAAALGLYVLSGLCVTLGGIALSMATRAMPALALTDNRPERSVVMPHATPVRQR